MYYKNILIFVFVLLFSCYSSAKNNTEFANLGFYSPPEQIIERLTNSQSSPERNFLLGITYKKQKDLKSALKCFVDSAFKSHRSGQIKLYAQPIYSFLKSYNTKSPYYDDAVNEIADIFFKYKEYEYAEKIAKLAGNSSPRISVETTLTIASSLSEMKKNDEAIKLLSNKLKEQNSRIAQSVLYMKRAAFYGKNLDYNSAIKDYISIIELNPENWRAGIAAQQIYRFITVNNINVSEDIIITTTHALIKNKSFNEAEKLSVRINANSRKTTHIQNRIELLLRKNQQAAFELLNIYPKNSAEYQNMLFFLAERIRISGNRNASVKYYDMLTSSNNKDLRLKALLRAGNIHERNNSALYRGYYEKYISQNGDPAEIQRMFWLMARPELRVKNNEKAKELLLKSVNASAHGTHSARAYFWLYKIFSAEQNTTLAEEALSNLFTKHPGSVYTWAALDILPQELSKDNLKKLFNEAKDVNNTDRMFFLHNLMFFTGTEKNAAKTRITSLPTSITDPYSKLEDYITKTKGNVFFEIQKYFAIGSVEYINKTLDYIPENKDLDEIKFATLTKFAYELNNATLTVNNMVKLMRVMSLSENLALMGNNSIKAIIPKGFENFVKSSSKRFSVPENLIYSITKAESMFNHQAVSSAGATGLMQLMPPTAADIAKRLNITQYSLTNPEISITFGTSYISRLNRLYKDQYIFSLAAYNAGMGNVNKWLQSVDTTDLDYFTEFVPFAETNYYIVRTGKFYKQYNLIYGNK